MTNQPGLFPAAPERPTTGKVVLEVRDLTTHLHTRSGVVKAVDGVSFDLHEGETLGIVGESGSGKSMTALSIMRLAPKPAARIEHGRVALNGVDLLALSEDAMRRVRGKQIAMVLQDPMTSLNPVFTIGEQSTEALRSEDGLSARAARDVALGLLRKVRIAEPETRMAAYPHQLSGGMRQRVVGAIAISRTPTVLIADEPTTSLDATIQLQYLSLLKELQAVTGVAILFITHDFGIVARMCDRVAVMYAGRIVELAGVRQLFNEPSHPYTRALINSVPDIEKDLDFLPAIEGQPPRPEALPPGCSFAPRCPLVFERCHLEYPPEFTVSRDHIARCWRLHDAG